MTQFKATHEPFDYPARNAEMYKDVDIPEPSSLYDFSPASNNRSFEGQKLDILGRRWEQATIEGKNRYPGLPFSLEGLDSIEARHQTYQKFVKDFMRSGAAIDQNIGKLLDYLEETRQLENTIVIYTADQGYFLGEHGFFDKRMIYEESMRMPFVISYPSEIKGGTRNQDLILNIDFPSLFLDYAVVKSPSSFQGRSFRSNLQGETPTDWRTSMYYRYWLHQTQRPAHFGIRTQRYKLAFFYGLPLDKPGTHKTETNPAWEFYDLQKDPQELENGYHDPANEEIIQQLKSQLLDLKEAYGDTDQAYPQLIDVLDKYCDK